MPKLLLSAAVLLSSLPAAASAQGVWTGSNGSRLFDSLPRILATLPAVERPPVSAQFYRVAAHPVGLYALADYVNFKGEGINPNERYRGQGWGLLQVILGMMGTETGAPALAAYARSAARVLERRVANSPPERNEARWLSGWLSRVATYRVSRPRV